MWRVWIVVFVIWLGCARQYGLYHEVKPGENFYRIAKAYEQNPDELAEINDLNDPSQLKIGDRVFIPDQTARRRVEVVRVPESPKENPKNLGSAGTESTSPQASARKTNPARAKPIPSSEQPMPEGTSTVEKGDFIWPVRGQLSSRFGKRKRNFHDGIDISAPQGTLIRAAAAGKVIYADRRITGYGNMIIIKHKGVYSTVYAHNQINYVKKNDFVERGEVIGRVGKTGRASGPHLHFELRKGRKAIDPLFYLPKRS